MPKTFEELLDGRKLHELTDEEITEIAQQMTPSEAQKMDKELKKQNRKRKSPSKSSTKNKSDFEKALFGGEE